MNHITKFFQQKILKLATGTSLTAPSAFYLALFMSDPTENGSAGTEISYTGYARQPITFSYAVDYIYNNAAITFPDIPENLSGSVTHVAVFDALTGGNMWLFAELGDPIAPGDALRISFGIMKLKWTFSGAFSPQYREKILKIFQSGTSIPGFTPYIALYNSSFVEISGGGYTRRSASFTVDTSDVYTLTNTNEVLFPTATAAWSSITRAAIVDASSGGERFVDFRFDSTTISAGSSISMSSITVAWGEQDE